MTVTPNGHPRDADPTTNVLDLVAAAIQRQDDLRTADSKAIREAIVALEKHVMLRFTAIDHEFTLIESHRVEQKIDCVEKSTPVLCADLVWRPAGDLKVGDELITCDDVPRVEVGTRTPRRFRRGVVTANSPMPDDLLRVVTSVGPLLCNAKHPLLTRNTTRGKWEWVRADALRPGDHVLHAVDVWEVEESWEGGWLAGILDGEGCLHRGSASRITIIQRVSDTADRIEDALSDRVVFSALDRRVKNALPTWSPQRSFQINRRADIMKILGSVRPPRLLVHADEVWEGQSVGGKQRATVVLGVESAGKGTVASLSTSTGTYIAAGFAVHNTKIAVDAALSAAEKAVKEQTLASEKSIIKSETSAAEQSKQQNATFTAAQKGVSDTLADVKDRVVKIESRLSGVREQEADRRGDQTVSHSGLMVIIGFLGLMLTVCVIAFSILAASGSFK